MLFNQPLEPRRYYQALYASALVRGGGGIDDDNAVMIDIVFHSVADARLEDTFWRG